jgi:hypothetical protein
VHLDLDARGELDAGGLRKVLAVVLDERAVETALQEHLDAGEHGADFASCSAFMRAARRRELQNMKMSSAAIATSRIQSMGTTFRVRARCAKKHGGPSTASGTDLQRL